MPPSVRARRVGYRLAYRVLQVVWFVFRPEVSGVKCLITHGNEILLVRHTYGPGAWDLPGGTMRRGEPALDAARREMHEELGIQDARLAPGWRSCAVGRAFATTSSTALKPSWRARASSQPGRAGHGPVVTRGTLPAELARSSARARRYLGG